MFSRSLLIAVLCTVVAVSLAEHQRLHGLKAAEHHRSKQHSLDKLDRQRSAYQHTICNIICSGNHTGDVTTTTQSSTGSTSTTTTKKGDVTTTTPHSTDWSTTTIEGDNTTTSQSSTGSTSTTTGDITTTTHRNDWSTSTTEGDNTTTSQTSTESTSTTTDGVTTTTQSSTTGSTSTIESDNTTTTQSSTGSTSTTPSSTNGTESTEYDWTRTTPTSTIGTDSTTITQSTTDGGGDHTTPQVTTPHYNSNCVGVNVCYNRHLALLFGIINNFYKKDSTELINIFTEVLYGDSESLNLITSIRVLLGLSSDYNLREAVSVYITNLRKLIGKGSIKINAGLYAVLSGEIGFSGLVSNSKGKSGKLESDAAISLILATIFSIRVTVTGESYTEINGKLGAQFDLIIKVSEKLELILEGKPTVISGDLNGCVSSLPNLTIVSDRSHGVAHHLVKEHGHHANKAHHLVKEHGHHANKAHHEVKEHHGHHANKAHHEVKEHHGHHANKAHHEVKEHHGHHANKAHHDHHANKAHHQVKEHHDHHANKAHHQVKEHHGNNAHHANKAHSNNHHENKHHHANKEHHHHGSNQ